MTNRKKSFFKERTKGQIKSLEHREEHPEKGLVEKIASLSSDEGMLVLSSIIPEDFHKKAQNQAERSRKYLKHGETAGYIYLNNPQTIMEAKRRRETPLAILLSDLQTLEQTEEDKNYSIGYSFKPFWGADTRRRYLAFTELFEASQIYAYSLLKGLGIEVRPYSEVTGVAKEGADVLTKIPSRTKSRKRYSIKLSHIPVITNSDMYQIPWRFSSDFSGGEDSEFKQTLIRYTRDIQPRGSQFDYIMPHEIAGYFATAKQFWKNGNKIPMYFTPFPAISRFGAEFYRKLENNILIKDYTIQAEDRLRKPHVAEKALLLSRAIGHFGGSEMFWKSKRDGPLEDYDWN